MTILTGTCVAQVEQAPGTMPEGAQIQVPGQQPQSPPNTDRGTLPSNPFPDNPPDATPPDNSPQPDDSAQPNADDDSPQPAAPEEEESQPSAGPARTARPAAPAEPARATAPSPVLAKPAEPAHVSLKDGQLEVTAQNSSLSAILHQLASASGMKVNGLSGDQRVFGSYGPGSPRDVLSSLLAGADYNVMMLGANPDGTPRELVLSSRSGGAAASMANNIQVEPDTADQSSANRPEYQAPAAPMAPTSPAPTSPIQRQNPNGTVKTPAELFQELQRLHQQQQQPQPHP